MERGARRGSGAVAGVVLAFVVLGLPDFAHGVAWPALRGDLDRGLADLGWLLIAATGGYLAIAGATGWLEERWGLRALIIGSGTAAGVGLAVVALARSWPLVVAGFVLHGAGSGGLDAGVNAHVALAHGASTMGFVHAGYGVGATLGPVVVRATALSGGGWRAAYAVLAVAHLAVLVVARRRTDRPAARSPAPTHSVKVPALWGALVFFVYVAFEVSVGQWAYVALTEDAALGATLAVACVAGYWIALTAGRLWLGARGHAYDGGRVLRWATAGAVLGAVFLAGGGPWMAAGLPITGLALSVVFPTLMYRTPDRVGSDRTATHVGLQAGAGALGAAVGPALMGLLLDQAGVGAYGPATLAVALLLFAVVARHPLSPAAPYTVR